MSPRLFTIFWFSIFVAGCLSDATTNQKKTETDPELAGDYTEGDMILMNQNRNGWIEPIRPWPRGIVFYRFANNHFDEAHRNHILKGMQRIEDVTCVRFIESRDAPYFVYITGMLGDCSSPVGWRNNTDLRINFGTTPINEGCFRLPTIVRHLLHTLGFPNMHNAYDRDEYVQILYSNTVPELYKYFKKRTSYEMSHYDTEYDYESLLHFGPFAGSMNGLQTIVPRKPEGVGVIGQSVSMSAGDIKRVNAMYGCCQQKTECPK